MIALLILLLSALVASAQPMTLGGPSIVHPTRYTVLDPYATPTLYVKWDAAGTGSGTSWVNAKTTIAAAITAAVNGDVIEVSGGTTGHTYTENLTVGKQITIQGSIAAGHNGPVLINGAFTAQAAANPATFRNLKFTVLNNRVLNNQANSSTTWKDCEFSHVYTDLSYSLIFAGTSCAMSRCSFIDLSATNLSGLTIGLRGAAGIGTARFDSCYFNQSGPITLAVAPCTWIFNNCTFLCANAVDGFTITTFNDGTSSIALTNCIFLGSRPISSGGALATNVSAFNCFWSPSSANTGLAYTNFESANRVSCVNALSQPTLPLFERGTNRIGQLFIRVDDTTNITNSWVAAQILNPEVVVNLAVYVHSVTTPFNSGNLTTLRQFLEAGNSVGCHSASHSDFSSTGALKITGTGTSPTVTIATVQAGDSSTWTGTMTVTINGVSDVIDLATASYDTLGEVISHYNGKAIGDGVVSMVIYSGSVSTSAISLMLASGGPTAISAQQTLSFDEPSFVRVEGTESILDLAAYIKSDTDRNGANATGLGAAGYGTISSNYVCRWFATPYGNGTSNLMAACVAQGLIGGNKVSGGASITDLYNAGSPKGFCPWDFMYRQNAGDSMMYGSACNAISSTAWTFPLWHAQPTYDDGTGASTAKLKTLLTKLKIGGARFSDSLYWLSTNTDFTAHSGTNFVFTGNIDTYILGNDWRPSQWSPIRRSGAPVATMADLNRIVTTGENPDIGAFKR